MTVETLTQAPYGYDYEVTVIGDGINPAASVAEASHIQDKNGRNTRDFFERYIFNPADSLVVDVQMFDEGLVSIAAAKVGWSDEDLLHFAADNNSFRSRDEQGHVETQTIDRMHPKVHRRYLRDTIASLIAAERHFGKQFQAFENNSIYVRGEQGYNPAKTLAQPHFRISSINYEAFTPSNKSWEFPHLRKERARVKKYLPGFFEQGREQMQELLDLAGAQMNLHENNIMYQIDFPFGREEALDPDNVAMVQQVMARHAQVYRNVLTGATAQLGEQSRKHIMFDTWRMKMKFNDYHQQDGQVVPGNLSFIFSPEPYSGAGPIEVFENANLMRRNDLPPVHHVDELKGLWAPVVADAKLLIQRAEDKAMRRQRVGDNKRILYIPSRPDLVPVTPRRGAMVYPASS